MANNIVDNLNSIISTKNEIAGVIRENGVNPGTKFSEYPGMLRSIIGAGGGGNISSYYVHGDHVCLTDDPDYNLKNLLVNSGAVSWDGTSYNYTLLVTETNANEWFPTYSYVESKIPVIDENIIPKESGSYTLGDASHLYNTLYIQRLVSTSTGMNVQIGNNGKYFLGGSTIRPAAVGMNLGTDTWPWNTVYTNAAYLQDTSYTKSIIPAGNDTYTLGDSSNYYHTLYSNRIQGNSSVNIRTGGNNRLTVTGTAFRPMQQNYNLGTSDYPFTTAYTSNIYLNGTNLEDRLHAIEVALGLV